jgi:hypothetical protein
MCQTVVILIRLIGEVLVTSCAPALVPLRNRFQYAHPHSQVTVYSTLEEVAL